MAKETLQLLQLSTPVLSSSISQCYILRLSVVKNATLISSSIISGARTFASSNNICEEALF
jgi:hypothetical protein